MTNFSLQRPLKDMVLEPDQPDLVYWQKIQSDDTDAFSYLFRRYYEPLYQFSGRFVKDPQTAESIVQDLFVKLWANRKDCQIKTSVKSYLYTAVKNHSLNHLKQTKKFISFEVESNWYANFVSSPEMELINNEMYTQIHRAINKLPQQCRQIYLMKKYDDLKYSEIADIFDISINTVKTQMKRAMKLLLRSLAHLVAHP
jgi:RNA polymerase sigma-19 factor, ECF subfamily